MELKIEVLDYTKNPLTKIGNFASECYQTKLKDENHAYRIGKHCLDSSHFRNLELARVSLKITGSARVLRELYTHIGGSPTRLQASTRYITYSDFDYYMPSGVTAEQQEVIINTMENIREGYKQLKDLGCANDITGYVLPLAMESTMVLECNARMLMNMVEQRECLRTLDEFRQLIVILKKKLKALDEEWEYIVNELFHRKCKKLGKCPEHNNKCPLYPIW